MGKFQQTDFDLARDELMSHIHRCAVLQAEAQEQQEWLDETAEYLSDRFPTLNNQELAELREIGERFCRPAIPHGKDHTALNR